MFRFGILPILLLSSLWSAHAGPVFYAIGYGNAPVFGTIDPNTAVVNPIGAPLAGYGHDIAVSPAGALYAVVDNDLFSIDKTTGLASLVGALPAGVQSLAFRVDGALFGASFTDLFTINPATAAGTRIGSLVIPKADNIRFDGSGNLYVMSAESNSGLYLVNTTSGQTTLVGLSGQDDISLGAFYGGVFIGTNAPVTPQIVTVDPATGAATAGASAGAIYLLALDPTSVPEPGTLGLLLAGAALFVTLKSRS